MSSAQGEYEARWNARRKRLEELHARQRTISNLRLLVFALALGLSFAAWLTDASPLWVVAPSIGFVALVFAHERAYRRAERARRAVEHYEAGLRRLDGTWPGHGNQRTDLAPEDHGYAADLDLFGRGSMFERLCLARTGAGVRELADWLLAPASVETVRTRQAAVDDLRARLDLREDLSLAGRALEGEVDPEYLAGWGERPPMLGEDRISRARVHAWGMGLVNVAVTVAWAVGVVGVGPLVGALLVTWIVRAPYREFAKQILFAVERPRRELEVAAAVMARLESESFTAERTEALRQELSAGPTSASGTIASLVRLVAWLDAMRSALFAPVGWALMWDVHFGVGIERWRRKHGSAIRGWFAALGELEALSSLAAYAYERPDDVFPEIVEGGPLLDGEAVGHPLLPAETCICNPIRLGPDRRALVISGSNMSGKSTYLRSVGLAVVLAQAGAPVFAERLRLSPLRVGATLRVQDSLQGGASRFFAEITRLRAVMDQAEAGPGLLFLLDEILHGTNSHDRRIGAEAVVATLLDHGTIGLVTTHDLALSKAAGAMPVPVDNVHFADTLIDGELVFDYTLKPGVVQTSNALDLMRAVGLRV